MHLLRSVFKSNPTCLGIKNSNPEPCKFVPHKHPNKTLSARCRPRLGILRQTSLYIPTLERNRTGQLFAENPKTFYPKLQTREYRKSHHSNDPFILFIVQIKKIYCRERRAHMVLSLDGLTICILFTVIFSVHILIVPFTFYATLCRDCKYF